MCLVLFLATGFWGSTAMAAQQDSNALQSRLNENGQFMFSWQRSGDIVSYKVYRSLLTMPPFRFGMAAELSGDADHYVEAENFTESSVYKVTAYYKNGQILQFPLFSKMILPMVRLVPIAMDFSPNTVESALASLSRYEKVLDANTKEELSAQSVISPGMVLEVIGCPDKEITLVGTMPQVMEIEQRHYFFSKIAIPLNNRPLSANALKMSGVRGLFNIDKVWLDGNNHQVPADFSFMPGDMIALGFDCDTRLDLMNFKAEQGQSQIMEEADSREFRGSPDDGTKVVVLYDNTYETKMYKCWASGKSGAWDGVTDAVTGADNVKNAAVVRRGRTIFVKDEAGMTSATPVTVYAPSKPGVARQAVSWSITWDAAKGAAAIQIPALCPVGDYQVRCGSNAANYATVYIILDPAWAKSKMTTEQYEAWAYKDVDWSSIADKYNYLDYSYEGGIGTYVWGYRADWDSESGVYGGVFGERMVEMACTIHGDDTTTDLMAAAHVYQVIGQRMVWSTGFGGYVNGKYNTSDNLLKGKLYDNSGNLYTKTELDVVTAEKAALGLGYTDRLASDYVFNLGQCMNFGCYGALLMRSVGIPAHAQYTDNGAGWPGSFHVWTDAAINDQTRAPYDANWWKGIFWKFDSCTGYYSTSISHMEGQIAPIVIDGYGDYLLNEYSRCQGIGYAGKYESNNKQCTSTTGSHTGVFLKTGTTASPGTTLNVQFTSSTTAWQMGNLFTTYAGSATPPSTAYVKDIAYGYALNSLQKGSSGGSFYVSNTTGEDDLPALQAGVDQSGVIGGMGYMLYRYEVNGQNSVTLQLTEGADKVEFLVGLDKQIYSKTNRWGTIQDYVSDSSGIVVANTAGITRLFIMLQSKAHTTNQTYQRVSPFTLRVGELVAGPSAAFTFSGSSKTINFTDASTCNQCTITKWNWNFGNGASSTAQHPSYTYPADGTYTVTLTVYSSNNKTDSKSNTVTVPVVLFVGHKEVFSTSSTNSKLTAQPITMPTAGKLQSISIYHNSGSGQMLLGVFEGDSLPTNRLAITASTGVSATAGWQTVSLPAPLSVAANKKLWLAWVFETNPGVYYQTGTPGRARAETDWTGGMPAAFGTSTQADSIYSIYAIYTTDDPPPANGDNLLGSFPTADGIWKRNSADGNWEKWSSLLADMVRAGDVNGNGTDDSGYLFKTTKQFWVRADNGSWSQISASADTMICFDLGDVNNDGQADLIASYSNNGLWWRNSVNGIWTQLSKMAPAFLAAGDFDGDKKADLVGLFPSLSEIWIRYNNGTWVRISKQINLFSLATGDIDKDGKDEIIGSWDIGVWAMDPDTNVWTRHHKDKASTLAVGDIDGDDYADIIGVWPTIPGFWVKYIGTNQWEKFSNLIPTTFAAGSF